MLFERDDAHFGLSLAPAFGEEVLAAEQFPPVIGEQLEVVDILEAELDEQEGHSHVQH